MAEVVDIEARRRAADGQVFCCCRCPDAGWRVVCRFRGLVPYLAALVCTGCQAEHLVEGGWLQGRTIQ